MAHRNSCLLVILICFSAPLPGNVSTRDNLLTSLWPPGGADALWFSDIAGDTNPNPSRPAIQLLIAPEAPLPSDPVGPLAAPAPAGGQAELEQNLTGVSQVIFVRDDPADHLGFFSSLNADPPVVTIGVVAVAAILAMVYLVHRRRRA